MKPLRENCPKTQQGSEKPLDPDNPNQRRLLGASTKDAGAVACARGVYRAAVLDLTVLRFGTVPTAATTGAAAPTTVVDITVVDQLIALRVRIAPDALARMVQR